MWHAAIPRRIAEWAWSLGARWTMQALRACTIGPCTPECGGVISSMRPASIPECTLARPAVLCVRACSPNAYSTAFEAKMLITLESRDGLRVTTEARLSAIKSDVDAFLHEAGQAAAAAGGAQGAAVPQ